MKTRLAILLFAGNLLPAQLDVTLPGEPPVRMPPTTSSPAPTEPVDPESTVMLFPLATATWSRAPDVATPL